MSCWGWKAVAVASEENFKRLIDKASKVHPQTWCTKNQKTVPTRTLVELRCWECREFILNGGTCDPL